jgi:hypothetical protein
VKKITDREFKVDYYEKERGGQEVWVTESQLKDDQHDIAISVEIDMIQMIVSDAKIQFNRFPLEHCPLIANKAIQLKGVKVDHEFSRNAMKIFMGPEGCPNIMSLLHISVPGIIYYYFPYKLKIGEMKDEEWEHMVHTDLKNACFFGDPCRLSPRPVLP